MSYATVEDLETGAHIPTVDVTLGDLTYQLAALTRAQVTWIRDTVGIEQDDDGNDLEDEDGNPVPADEEFADLMMLACSMVQPPLDPENAEHIELLKGLSMPHNTELVNEMMVLSGLREEDPTSATDE